MLNKGLLDQSLWAKQSQCDNEAILVPSFVLFYIYF